MKYILLSLLTLCALTTVAQPKAAIESVEIFGKQNQLVLPAVIAKIDHQTPYASRYICDGVAQWFDIYFKDARPQTSVENTSYLLEATTVYPRTDRFQVERNNFTLPNSKLRYYFAVFSVWSSNDFCVKDANGNLIKKFIIDDNKLTRYYYCRVGDEFKMVKESEFQIMFNEPEKYKLGGYASLQELDINLVSMMAGSGDRRNTMEKNLDFVRHEISNSVKATSSAIADLLFAETHLNGFLHAGFKMHVLKKSSVKHYPQIDAKTEGFRSLIAGWSQDIDNVDLRGELLATAIEFEKLGNEATDESIRILCFANASLGYTMVGEFDKAKSLRKLAKDNDKSWFGVVGHTTPNLFEYLHKRNAILSADILLNYRTLVSEAKM